MRKLSRRLPLFTFKQIPFQFFPSFSLSLIGSLALRQVKTRQLRSLLASKQCKQAASISPSIRLGDGDAW